MKLTPNRMVILRELLSGPKSWTQLRIVYYGTPERIASNASTSFHNQLHKLINGGMISKAGEGYSITDLGREWLVGVDADVLAKAKTEAHISSEIRKELNL